METFGGFGLDNREAEPGALLLIHLEYYHRNIRLSEKIACSLFRASESQDINPPLTFF